MTKCAWIIGCGDVGSVAGCELAELGYAVFGMRRDPSRIPSPIRAIGGDATDPCSYAALSAASASGVDLVLYTASASGASDAEGYRRAYVDGPRALLDALAARRLEPRRLVFASSTSVYAQDDGSIVDEDSATEPLDFRGRVMLDAERQVLAAPFPASVVRFGGIYGPGRTFLVDAVRAGRLGLSRDGDSPHTNRIHRDDAARALVHVARLESAAPVYVAVDREPARRDEVVRWLAARLGITPAVGDAARMRGGDKQVLSARLVASGFAFRHPTFREGYAALLASGNAT